MKYNNNLHNQTPSLSGVEQLQKQLAYLSREDTAVSENKQIPAGYTYLGQLIAHDLSALRLLDPSANPSLHLATLYGGGPHKDAVLYDWEDKRFQKAGVTFRLFQAKDKIDPRGEDEYFDWHRIDDQWPIMADSRNDQNYLLSQIAIAFCQFHNRLATAIDTIHPGLSRRTLFQLTRVIVSWHYQWIILEDYLPRILDYIIQEALQSCLFSFEHFSLRCLFRPNRLSPEFANAAFRFGHSQVKKRYFISDHIDGKLAMEEVLFSDHRQRDLKGFKRDPYRNIQWKYFFETGANGKRKMPEPSNSINTNQEAFLSKIFDHYKDRVDVMRIEPGAQQMRSTRELLDLCDLPPLTNDQLPRTLAKVHMDVLDFPLWVYVLCEAEVLAGGQSLGPLGSRIVGEQIMWVLKKDRYGILRHRIYQRWKEAGIQYDMSRLLKWQIIPDLPFLVEKAKVIIHL